MKHPVIFWRNFSRLRNLVDSFELDSNDLVLDVGSGQNPNPRANVLCDRFAFDDTERNQNPLIIDRPLVLGDAARLPFRDKAFDYVICCHLLEHVADPEAVIRELVRVGKRGYIETPGAVWEKLHSFPFHRWYVRRQGEVLCFEEKTQAVHDAELKQWINESLGRSALASGFEREFDNLELLVRLHWTKEFPVRVERKGTAAQVFEGSTAHGHHAKANGGGPSVGTKIIRAWARQLRQRADRRVANLEDLLALCACPYCGEGVQKSGEQIVGCSFCKKSFPLKPLSGRAIPELVKGS